MLIRTDNGYSIENVTIDNLIYKYDLPLYVYSTHQIARQYKKFVNAFPGINLKVQYACKALTNINILTFIKQLGAGLDTVSINEVLIGLKAGFQPKDIIYTPSGVSFKEITEVVSKKTKINLDNQSVLKEFGTTYGSSYPISIRINPNIMAGGHKKISTGHKDSKFGIPLSSVSKVLEIINSYNIQVEGLHLHTGSDILDNQSFIDAAKVLMKVAMEFPNLQFIDLGSGFKVPYKEGDKKTDIEKLGRLMVSEMQRFNQAYGKPLELILEPGKFLVSTAGYFLVRTNVLKETPSTVFAGVDSGQNHLIRPMFYDAYHEIVNLSNPWGPIKPYSVVGYICETDTFAWNREIPEIRQGDILCFKNAGAYCFTMTSNYNSRPRPAEVMIYQGKDYLIRKRENLDDLLHNQPIVDI